MGAQDFSEQAWGKDVKEAFQIAKEEALHYYGHGGYSGSLAEKDSYVVKVPGGVRGSDEWTSQVDDLTYDNDKWGPAVAVLVHIDEGPPYRECWQFCGFASS